MSGLVDSFQRPINYLRISVTDRCNLRCVYCMPAEGIKPIKHGDVLSFEEIARIVNIAAGMGFRKIRLTGGEPLVRLGISRLVAMIHQIKGIDDIAMTTNGILLAKYARELKEAGLNRVNISLDTLKPERYREVTRIGCFDDVIQGIAAAREYELNPVKINTVVIAGFNDDEMVELARKSITDGWNVRFIELMPTPGALDNEALFIAAREMKKRLDVLGKMEACMPEVGNTPAKYYRFPGASGTVGFIAPVSEHFCERCNRIRLTSDGKLLPCLLSDAEIDIKTPLRSDADAAEVEKVIQQAVAAKPMQHNLGEGRKPKVHTMTEIGG